MDGEVRPSTSTCPHPIPTTNPDPNIPWPLARGESDLTVKVGIDMVQAGRPAATGVPEMWPGLSLLVYWSHSRFVLESDWFFRSRDFFVYWSHSRFVLELDWFYCFCEEFLSWTGLIWLAVFDCFPLV
jgi:hypothetical protein